jgi:TPR repeat protein
MFYQRAAEQGNSDAKEALGKMYRDGKGVPKSMNKAVAFWEQAAKEGHINAMSILGDLLVVGGYPDAPIPKDLPRGLALLRTAMEKGSPDAAYCLAQCYFHGLTGTVDYKEAQRLYEKAAKIGLPIAKEFAKLTEVFHYLDTGNFMTRSSNVINTAFQVSVIFSMLAGKSQRLSLIEGVAAAFSTVHPDYGMLFRTAMCKIFDTPDKIVSASKADFKRAAHITLNSLLKFAAHQAAKRGEDIRIDMYEKLLP